MMRDIFPAYGPLWNKAAHVKLHCVEGLIHVIQDGYQPGAFPVGFSSRHQMVLAHLARACHFAKTGVLLGLNAKQDELCVLTRVISEHWFKLTWIWDSHENYLTLLVGEEVYDYLKNREPKHTTAPVSAVALRQACAAAGRRLRNYKFPPGRYTRQISSDANARKKARENNPTPYKRPPSLKDIAHEVGFHTQYEYLYNLQSKETHPSVAALSKYIRQPCGTVPWQLISDPQPSNLLQAINDLRFVLFGIIEVMESKGCKVRSRRARALFLR